MPKSIKNKTRKLIVSKKKYINKNTKKSKKLSKKSVVKRNKGGGSKRKSKKKMKGRGKNEKVKKIEKKKIEKKKIIVNNMKLKKYSLKGGAYQVDAIERIAYYFLQGKFKVDKNEELLNLGKQKCGSVNQDMIEIERKAGILTRKVLLYIKRNDLGKFQDIMEQNGGNQFKTSLVDHYEILKAVEVAEKTTKSRVSAGKTRHQKMVKRNQGKKLSRFNIKRQAEKKEAESEAREVAEKAMVRFLGSREDTSTYTMRENLMRAIREIWPSIYGNKPINRFFVEEAFKEIMADPRFKIFEDQTNILLTKIQELNIGLSPDTFGKIKDRILGNSEISAGRGTIDAILFYKGIYKGKNSENNSEPPPPRPYGSKTNIQVTMMEFFIRWLFNYNYLEDIIRNTDGKPTRYELCDYITYNELKVKIIEILKAWYHEQVTRLHAGRPRICIYCGQERADIEVEHIFGTASLWWTDHLDNPFIYTYICSSCNKRTPNKKFYSNSDNWYYSTDTDENIFKGLTEVGNENGREIFYCHVFLFLLSIYNHQRDSDEVVEDKLKSVLVYNTLKSIHTKYVDPRGLLDKEIKIRISQCIKLGQEISPENTLSVASIDELERMAIENFVAQQIGVNCHGQLSATTKPTTNGHL